MSKEAGDNEKVRGNHEPWTNKERHIIVQHVLKHVLANVGYGSIFNELIDVLDKEGLPRRSVHQMQDQWRRKICKDLLSIYGPSSQDASDTSPRTPTKTSGGSPGKRKRNTE